MEQLHQDLLAVFQNQIQNIDRLWAQLSAQVEEIRGLIDQNGRREASRKTLLGGTINVDAVEYAVNVEFQESAVQLADILDLDELESARLILEAQKQDGILDRPVLATAVVGFHQRRQLVLECFRLVLAISSDSDQSRPAQELGQQFLSLCLNDADEKGGKGIAFVGRCIQGLIKLETWYDNLSERQVANSILGTDCLIPTNDMVSFQQQSLLRQHESLAAIMHGLIKSSYASLKDFDLILDHIAKLQRWGKMTINYMPIVLAGFAQFGSPEDGVDFAKAQQLNQKIMCTKEQTIWGNSRLQAAIQAFWLAEYSAWFQEPSITDGMSAAKLEADAEERSRNFFAALDRQAFQIILGACFLVTPIEAYDPARSALLTFLMDDGSLTRQDSDPASEWFNLLFMEQLEIFIDAFITNMPDTLRRFKSEEDEQRKRLMSSLAEAVQPIVPQQYFHLERFLVIASFAFDGRAEAAHGFWADPDGNLYGFMQWAARRQSTPTVSAFCEMLRSICTGEENANAAHQFLLHGSGQKSARVGPLSFVSWTQIFNELECIVSKHREPSQASRLNGSIEGTRNVASVDEPESALMLENYLRLIAHICTESSEANAWIIAKDDPPVLQTLLMLAGIYQPVPGPLQASALRAIRALLANKPTTFIAFVWDDLDAWASGAGMNELQQKSVRSEDRQSFMQNVAFVSLASGFDQANEFAALLASMCQVRDSQANIRAQLTFSEDLGSSYRAPGIGPYVDFMMDRILAKQLPQLDNDMQSDVLAYNVLNFIGSCLNTFDEILLVIASKTGDLGARGGSQMERLIQYVNLHPFCRIMNWLFNDRVLAAIFKISHRDAGQIAASSPESPGTLALIRCIEILNMVVDLQSTYLNVVRPMTKLRESRESSTIANMSLTSFEDSVASNLQLIIDLGLYAGTGHHSLALPALELLGKLASSSRLSRDSYLANSRNDSCRLVTVVEQDGDIDRIVVSLIEVLRVDSQQSGLGTASTDWTIKSVIINTILQILTAFPNRPNLAHALLGLKVINGRVAKNEFGHSIRDISLLHCIVDLILEYPQSSVHGLDTLALSLRRRGLQILAQLWRSKLTSSLILNDLRSVDFLARLVCHQEDVGIGSVFAGFLLNDPLFLYSEGGACLQEYIWQQQLLFEYMTAELRNLFDEGPTSSIASRTLMALLGSTSLPTGEVVETFSALDLVSCVDLVPQASNDRLQLKFFAEIDYDLAAYDDQDQQVRLYDIKLVDELTFQHLEQVVNTGNLQEASSEQQQLLEEAESILLHFKTINQQVQLDLVRQNALSSWADLVTVIMEQEASEKKSTSEILTQALQAIAPRLQCLLEEGGAGAFSLLALTKNLFTKCQKNAMMDVHVARVSNEIAMERCAQLYGIVLRAINDAGLDHRFRELFYTISECHVSAVCGSSQPSRYASQALAILKAMGSRTVDIICDDAFGAPFPCRVAAMLFLNSVASIALSQQSSIFTDLTSRTNFVQVLVESIENIPIQTKDCDAQDIPSLLIFYEAKLALILTIAQDKKGVLSLVDADIFGAIRASGLFAVDPDIGIDINNPDALAKYYRLLLFLTRIIATLLLSRGSSNTSALQSGRIFLEESRPLVVAVFKRQAKIGGVSFDSAGVEIDELADLFTLIVSMTNFLPHESERFTKRFQKYS